MDEQWTEWRQHDGKGCPCVGMVVEVVRRNGTTLGPFVAWQNKLKRHDDNQASNWAWCGLPFEVISYRIRKPRALIEMIENAADLDAPVREEV